MTDTMEKFLAKKDGKGKDDQQMEGQVKLDGVSNEDSKVNDEDNQNKSVEKMLQKASEDVAGQSEEEQEENLVKVGKRLHASHTERKTVRSILQMYADKKIVLPLCQRLYVWDKKHREDLMDTIERGLLCGSIELATLEGGNDTQYLCDGLQRIVSLMLMSNDENFTDEQKVKILNFKVSTEVVYDLNNDEMAIWFLRLNSGITVASSVKERSKLSQELNMTILNVSGNDFFRNISEKANATFAKNHHHELIAMNTLLACAGAPIGDNKAKALCTKIQEYEADVKTSVEKANNIVNRFADIYNNITDDGIVKRSLNANFLSVVSYAMVKNESVTNDQIVKLINTIFVSKRAIKEYSETTGSGSASADKTQKRYDVIMNLLNNPVQNTKTEITNVDDKRFKAFKKRYKGEVITTLNGNNGVDFSEFTEDEQKQLCQCENMQGWNDIVNTKYAELEKQKDIVA